MQGRLVGLPGLGAGIVWSSEQPRSRVWIITGFDPEGLQVPAAVSRDLAASPDDGVAWAVLVPFLATGALTSQPPYGDNPLARGAFAGRSLAQALRGFRGADALPELAVVVRADLDGPRGPAALGLRPWGEGIGDDLLDAGVQRVIQTPPVPQLVETCRGWLR